MPNLTTSLLSALVLVVFRGVPFFFYTLVSKRFSPVAKAVILIASAAGVFWLNRLGASAITSAINASLAFGYFFFVALGVYWLRNVYANGNIGKLPLFTLFAATYTFLPALFAPGVLAAQMVVLGWEIMLASYSYCLDTSREATRPRLGDCLFFLLVNPTIVYELRGECFGNPRLDPRGIARCCLGVAAAVFHGFCLAIMATLSSQNLAFSEWDGNTIIFLFTYYLKLYAAHSCLASIQIGLMRLIGYRVPERYHYPFLATSPLDLWQRWNIWVSHWLQRYIFYPVSLHLARSDGWISRAAKPMGVAATFLAIGALHDWTVYIRHINQAPDPISLGYTVLFSLFGVELMIWVGAARALGMLGLGRQSGRLARASTFIVCLVLMQTLKLANARILLPVLSGGGVPW